MASPFDHIADASSVADGSKIWDVAARCRQTHGQSSFQIRKGQRAGALPQSPSPIPAYMIQLLSSFIGLYLPKDSHHGAISGRTPSSWVHLLAYSNLHSSAYMSSLAALCTSQLGTWHKDEAMLNESIRLYASSLRELRTKILNGNIQKDSEATLASIVLLSTYEVRMNLEIIMIGFINTSRHFQALPNPTMVGLVMFKGALACCNISAQACGRQLLENNSLQEYVLYV
jgi:hypothetical protein